MNRVPEHGRECSVRWCDETGAHTAHRKYVASVPGGLHGTRLVGVNVVLLPRRDAQIELTVTSPATPPCSTLLPASSATTVGLALINAAERVGTSGQ